MESNNSEQKKEIELAENVKEIELQSQKNINMALDFSSTRNSIENERVSMDEPRTSIDIVSPRPSNDFVTGEKRKKVRRTKSLKEFPSDLSLAVKGEVKKGMEKADKIYHKFKERDRTDSLIGATFNLVNSTIGAGILSLPYVLHSCGILIGIPFLILGALITYITLVYLHTSHQYALEKDPNLKDYEDIGYFAYGRIMSFIIKICIIAFSFGAMISYVIIITDFSIPIWRQIAGNNTILSERWLAAIIIVIPLFFLSLVRRMGDLRWISYLSVSCTILFIGFLVIGYATGNTNPEKFGEIVWIRVDVSMFKVIGIIIFAFACHTNVCPINYEFKNSNRHRVAFSLYLSILISFTFYFMCAIFGYLSFLDNTQGSLFKSFSFRQENWYNQIFAAIFNINVYVSYPLVCLPLKISLDNLLSPLWRWKIPLGMKPKVPESLNKYNITKDLYIYLWDSMESIRYFFITVIVCLITYFCGVFIPSIDIVFSIVGATAGSLLAYIIPVMLYIKLTKLPWRNWKVIFSIFFLIFSILVGIFITIVTILDVAGVI